MNLLLLIPLALDSEGITAWVMKNIIPLILLFIGLGIMFAAKKGRWSDTMSTVGIVLIGLVIIAGAAGLRGLGDEIANQMFKGAPAVGQHVEHPNL